LLLSGSLFDLKRLFYYMRANTAGTSPQMKRIMKGEAEKNMSSQPEKRCAFQGGFASA